jgi:hypothetical protein
MAELSRSCRFESFFGYKIDKLFFFTIFIIKNMNMRNFNSDDYDDFRKEFIKFLSMYQSGLDNFFGDNFFNVKPITGSIKGLTIESGLDKYGEWEKSSWTSEDGLTSYTSFVRSSGSNRKDENTSGVGRKTETIQLLESKLDKAILEENYEEAAKIRDLIKSLREELI